MPLCSILLVSFQFSDHLRWHEVLQLSFFSKKKILLVKYEMANLLLSDSFGSANIAFSNFATFPINNFFK